MRDELMLSHQFVEFMPSQLEENTLYISPTFKTAIHLCCCGCGHKVVTRLSPRHWKLIFDGETVSLWPSIGNHSFQCRSHYWIKRSHIKWDFQWTDAEIAAKQKEELESEERYFASLQPLPEPAKTESISIQVEAPLAPKYSLWNRLKHWIRSHWH